MLYQNFRDIKAQRGVEDRWDIIKSHIFGSLIDVGSDIGAFSILAQEELNLPVILSIERESESIKEHIRLLNGKTSLICHILLDNEILTKLYHSCFYSDTLLLMSVLHWFENPKEVLEIFASLCNILICEIPRKDDINAYGQNIVQQDLENIIFIVGEKLNKTVEKIGEVESHSTKGSKRPIYKISGYVERGLLKPYCDYDGIGKHNLKVVLEKNDYISGFNLYDCLKLNLIYPDSNWLKKDIDIKIEQLQVIPNKTDFRIWNMILQNKGVEIIDYLDETQPLWKQEDYDSGISVINNRNLCEYFDKYAKVGTGLIRL